MHNIIISLVALLFLASCSEENNKSDNKEQSYIVIKKTNELEKENEATKQEIIEPPLVIEEETIVEPKTTEEISSNESLNEITPAPEASLEETNLKSMVTFNINQHDIVIGNKESKVVLVEYFSPTCPHCAYYETKIFPEIKKRYIDTNKIAYVIREFIGNKQDLDAAILARCNNKVDSFLQFTNVILERQDSWAYSTKYRELLTTIGQIGGVSPEAYQKCLADNEIAEILLDNTNFVSKVTGFIGTPAFFINGMQVSKGHSLDNISQALDEALSSSKKNNIN